MAMKDTLTKVAATLEAEEGHAYAWGGGTLVAIILIVLLLVLLF